MALPNIQFIQAVDWAAIWDLFWKSGAIVWICFFLTGIVLGFAIMGLIIKANSARF